MRRRLLVSLVCACLVLPALAAAADTEPQKRFTAADQAHARSLLLTRADFTNGWKRTSSPNDSGDYRCPGFNPDESDLTLTGEADAAFTNGAGAFVGSSTGVYESVGDARSSWTRNNKPAVAGCLAHMLREVFAKDGGVAKVTRSGRLAFPKAAPRVAAFRVAATVTLPGLAQPLPLVMHLVVLSRGRAQVALMAMAPGRGVAEGDLRAFAHLLGRRLATAGV